MAWAAARGLRVQIRHAVRDLAGALVTGQAGALTFALSTPAGGASGLPVTAAEIGTTGWYLVSVTPDAAGAWALDVTNPAAPVSDGQTVEYALAVADVGIPGALAGAYGLTTLALVHDLLKIPDSETGFDPLLETLIDGVTSQIEQRANRHVGVADYVETLDGWGRDRLWLAQGPMVSVTEVAELAYRSTGVVATVIDPTDYLAIGQPGGAGDLDERAAVLRVDGGIWTRGRANWRVTYRAGHAVIPPALTLDATRLVAAHFRRSDVEGLIQTGALDLSTTPLDPAELDRLTERIAGQWRLQIGAI